MKRCTIELQVGTKWPANDMVKLIVEQEFSRTFRLGKAVFVSSPLKDVVSIEILSEFGCNNLFDLFQALEPKLDAQIIRIGWGWLVTDAVDGSKDPYVVDRNSDAALEEYRYALSVWQKISFTASIICFSIFLLGLWISVGQMMVSGFMLAFFFALATITPINQIYCRDDDIVFKYSWLFWGMVKRLEWNEITEVEVKWARSKWCFVKTRAKQVSFPISGFYQLQNADALINAIREHASLRFVEGHSFGEAIYRSFDLQQ